MEITTSRTTASTCPAAAANAGSHHGRLAPHFAAGACATAAAPAAAPVAAPAAAPAAASFVTAFFITFAALVLSACGGPKVNRYQRALSAQEACCTHLRDPGAHDACMREIPRVDSTAAETAPTNQETFGCVERHFVCEPSTGRATRASAQAQLDCLNELESTAQYIGH